MHLLKTLILAAQSSHRPTTLKAILMSRQQRITHLLEQHFSNSYLSVENESNQHHVPQDSETHFRVEMVSIDFEGLSRVLRHQRVNLLLKAEFNSGMHALSLHLYTTQEWQSRQKAPILSPNCKDGFDK